MENVKNLVLRHVKSGKVVINTPEKFAHYADKVCVGVTSLYLPKEEFLEEQVIQTQHPEVKKSLQVHKI